MICNICNNKKEYNIKYFSIHKRSKNHMKIVNMINMKEKILKDEDIKINKDLDLLNVLNQLECIKLNIIEIINNIKNK
jgi:hypothetical protein